MYSRTENRESDIVYKFYCRLPGEKREPHCPTRLKYTSPKQPHSRGTSVLLPNGHQTNTFSAHWMTAVDRGPWTVEDGPWSMYVWYAQKSYQGEHKSLMKHCTVLQEVTGLLLLERNDCRDQTIKSN